MNIKKLFSLFMVIVVTLTSSVSCYASDVVIPDTDTDVVPSVVGQPSKAINCVSGDIVIPDTSTDMGSGTADESFRVEIPDTDMVTGTVGEPSEVIISDTDIVPNTDSESPKTSWEESLENAKKADEDINDIRNASAAKQNELEDIHRKVRKRVQECADLEIKVKIQRKELQEWSNDVLCKNCSCCCASDATKSLKKDEIPVSSTLRSKKFYIGVIAGAVIVAVVLVGSYVYKRIL